ncbi:glycosyltransferase [Maribacter sp.]|uniref:glycosyltransferase family 2 protein n=1 Tax=Maribacter sp. TaxID=1897614 RepID=UPI0025BFDD36|nr:glycosyltransferase [Maribacter sp.]
MKKIAILYTCFNRKQKTLESLANVYNAIEESNITSKISIYLTDDGSTDGTSDAVRNTFKDVIILEGSGSLFWAGGMRKSWNEALKEDFDAYLLLNDDTYVIPTLFKDLMQMNTFCVEKYKQTGIYLGAVKDPKTQKRTYGGAVLTNKFLFKYRKLNPTGKIQECDLGNANIMFVTKSVVDKIGILSESFVHGVADYDYTLTAVNKKLPVLLSATYLGECENDHGEKYGNFTNKSYKERKALLLNPVGLDFKSNMALMKRHFPFRVPMVFLAGWLKVIFPKLYLIINEKR